jgi:hypothetical protein
MQPGDFLSAVADLPAIGRELEAMGNPRPGVIEACLERWLDVDRENLLRFLAATQTIIESETLKLPQIGAGDLHAAYVVLARREPDWFAERLGTLGEKLARSAAVGALLQTTVQTNPKKAREHLESFRGTAEWKAAFTAYVQGLTLSDPAAAMDLALSPDGRNINKDGAYLIANTFIVAMQRSPSAGFKLLPKLDPEERRSLTWWALGALTEEQNLDPLAWMQEQVTADPELLSSRAGAGFPPHFIRPLIKHNPAKTLEWIEAMPDEAKQVMLQATLQDPQNAAPDALLAWVARQPAGTLPSELHSVRRAASVEPERFSKWVAALPSGPLRERSQVMLAEEFAKQGRLTEALATFPRNATDPLTAQSTGELAWTAAGRDPNATAQWIGALPAGPAQTAGAKQLVRSWAAQAPDAAAAWIESLPAGRTRDTAAGAFAGVAARKDPEAAREWLQQITDPALRSHAAGQVFTNWAVADAASAREWLRGSPDASEALKTRLLRVTP